MVAVHALEAHTELVSREQRQFAIKPKLACETNGNMNWS